MSSEMLEFFYKATRQRGFMQLYLLYSAAAGLTLLIIVGVASYRHANDARYLADAQAQDREARLLASQDQLAAVLRQQEDLRGRLELLSRNVTQPGKVSLPVDHRLSLLQSEMEKTQKQLEGLNELLGDDPAKRMSVVLLTRDVQQLKDEATKDAATLRAQYQTELTNLRDDSRSNFELMKWAFGFVGASNLIVPALAFFFQNRKAKPESA